MDCIVRQCTQNSPYYFAAMGSGLDPPRQYIKYLSILVWWGTIALKPSQALSLQSCFILLSSWEGRSAPPGPACLFSNSQHWFTQPSSFTTCCYSRYSSPCCRDRISNVQFDQLGNAYDLKKPLAAFYAFQLLLPRWGQARLPTFTNEKKKKNWTT